MRLPPCLEFEPRQGGFTLLEIVVVLMLIGIITGFAVLSLGTDPMKDQVNAEGRRMAAIIGHHRELAMLRLEQRGVLVSENGYRILRLRKDKWEAVADRSAADRSELPDGLTLQLSVAELPATLKGAAAKGSEDDEDEPTKPQIWIFSTGELLPFELVLSDIDERYRFVVEGSAGGRITSRSEFRVE
jgi:general secretion pathway protein H